MDPTESLPEDDDLTVLEYVRNWIDSQIRVREKPVERVDEQLTGPEISDSVKPVFWIGLILAVLGQIMLGLERQSLPIAGLLMIISGMICLWFGIPGKVDDAETLTPQIASGLKFHFKLIWFLAALAMGVVSFLLFTENRFGWLQTLSWLTAIACALYAFWPEGNPENSGQKMNWRFWQGWRQDKIFFILVLIVAALTMIFRLKDLTGLPPEVISGQVETYFSVSEIRQGADYILFSRNTIPEPLNYYWANIVALFSGRTLKIESIRLASSLAGLIGVGMMYSLGKTIANRWVGLAAAGLAGVSFWLVLQERALIGGGLVFPLMTGALFGLVKGLDEQDGRYFLLSAVASGLGLMSNKIFLIFPLVAGVVILSWKSGKKSLKTVRVVALLGIGLFLSLITAIPLVRAISLDPISYFSTILARIGEYEVSYPGNPLLIFLGNLIKALGITNWTNHGSWVDSIANRAAVDGLTAVFFLVGIISLIRRYQVSKDWKLLLPLLLYPVLVLPSALTLAFPGENPSMTRAVGAAVPAMLISAYGLVEIIRILSSLLKRRSLTAVIIISVLISGSIVINNYNLIFKQYASNYKKSSWNASVIGEVINRFYSSGREGLSYLISYPYWVDSRAVAISMGRAEQNLSLPATEIANTQSVSLPKLFILNPMDKDSIAELQSVYPEGVISTYQSTNPDKNFIIFIVGQ